MTEQLPAAVLWDMDGTLVDTEPYWLEAEEELVGSFGGTWTHEDGLTLVGSGLTDSAAILQGRGVAMPVDEIVNWLTDRVMERIAERVSWRPGALELLAEIRDAGIPTALVTMSLTRMAEVVVAHIPFPAFDFIVGGDQVEHNKPHPDPYLRAANLLGVDVTCAVAIEDSATGLASAVASGAASVGVPLHVPLGAGRGYEIWPSLAGKTLADLSGLLGAARSSAA
ncbi:MAG: putative phosphatase [Microbacteriaceae bacterium]|nr:putative phosphatase [Microbacteriaceae bacterium]